MAPALTKPDETPKTSSILHRTPWRPPVAVSGEGIYLELEDGRRIIDAVGGAAVTCIGNGHPEVKKAIKEQVDKLSCMSQCLRPADLLIDAMTQMSTICNCRISRRRSWRNISSIRGRVHSRCADLSREARWSEISRDLELTVMLQAQKQWNPP